MSVAPNEIRIVVCDPHEVIRLGARRLSDFTVVADSGDWDDIPALVGNYHPSILLTETHFGNQPHGIKMARKIIEDQRTQNPELPKTKVVFMSQRDNPTFVGQAVAIGAHAYWLKSERMFDLTDAIFRAHFERQMPEDSPIGRMEKFMDLRYGQEAKIDPATLTAALSNREAQVLRHLTLGLTNEDIATSLHVSIETVKEHVQNLFRKMDCRDRTAAATIALRKKLVVLNP